MSRDIIEKADCSTDNDKGLCLLEIEDRRVGRPGAKEGDDGMEPPPNRSNWVYSDEPNGQKIFAEVDSHSELNYRQKTQLEGAVGQVLSGNLKDLSWDLDRDEGVRSAFAQIMEKNGIEVKMGTEPEYKGYQMTMKLPDSNESLVFGWRGGLTPVYGVTKDGNKVAIDSVNKSEENLKALNQVFSRLIHQFRLDYMEPSMMR